VSSFEQSVIDHGRKEVRRCFASTDVEWLQDCEKCAGLTSIALVEYCRDVCGAGDVEQRLYISSSPREAEALLKATRKHWEIENKVHWVLDVSFEEDPSRIRRRDGAENSSRLRRMALGLAPPERYGQTQKHKRPPKTSGMGPRVPSARCQTTVYSEVALVHHWRRLRL
jgi:predicted transposase YbfD/YdcC